MRLCKVHLLLALKSLASVTQRVLKLMTMLSGDDTYSNCRGNDTMKSHRFFGRGNEVQRKNFIYSETFSKVEAHNN